MGKYSFDDWNTDNMALFPKYGMNGFINVEKQHIVFCQHMYHIDRIRKHGLPYLPVIVGVFGTTEDLYILLSKHGWHRFGTDRASVKDATSVEFFNVPQDQADVCKLLAGAANLKALFYTPPLPTSEESKNATV